MFGFIQHSNSYIPNHFFSEKLTKSASEVDRLKKQVEDYEETGKKNAGMDSVYSEYYILIILT